jgi:hypothetical protein
MSDPRSRLQRAIQRYRRLREWVTDLRARRALRELIRSAEAELVEEKGEERAQDKRDEEPTKR